MPEWVAFASHDFHGADLRRRWDDRTDLELEGLHPVVYAGAGSHASYFKAGEYQAEVPFPCRKRVRDALEVVQRFWRQDARARGAAAPTPSARPSSTSPAATG